MNRRACRTVSCGTVKIGAAAPISVQSMLNIPPADIESNLRAAASLAAAGCDILRIAVPDEDGVRLVAAIKENVAIPLVADIHFDYRLAIESVAAGVDKVRINPGNIGGDDRVRLVAEACRAKNVPIRIGVNSGSVSREILAKYGAPTAQALCDSALYHASLLERWDFHDIVLSLKSSHVPTMIEAYRLAAASCDYPLHLGVTETGTAKQGVIKSAVGIGTLLAEGIGDTVRVSLTDEPIREVEAAKGILRALELRNDTVNIISCPTCGRTKNDLIGTVNRVEEAVHRENLDKKKITVAIMGCAVNGPGEAREADVGMACGERNAVIFKKGEKLRSVRIEDAVEELLKEIRSL